MEAGESTIQGMFEWPETAIGSEARLQCPCATNPDLTQGIFAIRKCQLSGAWSQPDWSACRLSTQAQRLCTVVSRIVQDTVKVCNHRKCLRCAYLCAYHTSYICVQSKSELLSVVRNATANKTRRLGAGDVAMLASAVEALTDSNENINNEEVGRGKGTDGLLPVENLWYF